jgi:hypothetical protein
MKIRVAMVALVVGTTLGCRALTDVHEPDVIQPGTLNTASGADAMRLGALQRFTDGVTVSLAPFSAITDELFSAASSGGRDDRRFLPTAFGADDFAFHATRINALRAIAAYEAYAPSQRTRIGQMFATVGLVEVFLAEDFCNGIPLSGFVGDDPQFGKPLTTAQMFTQAAADFDSAIAWAGADPKIGSFAPVGKGRALVGLGQFGAAAVAVAGVPTSFVYQTENSAAVQPNQMVINWTGLSVTVADREGVNGFDYVSANDPRVQLTKTGKGRDGVTDVYQPNKYLTTASPVILASGVEARLIEAEALLKNGQAQAALNTLNALRTTVAGLAPLTLQPTAAAQVDQLFRERAFWLFMTNHRLGDMRRLISQYARATESVFPTGAYRDGLTYGTDTNFAPNASELNNPNFTGCIDRNP